jgi:hypothetical protein
MDRQVSRIWTVKAGNNTWRRHENQIKRRCWSNEEDAVTMNSTTSKTSTNLDNSLTLSDSSSNHDSPRLRCTFPFFTIHILLSFGIFLSFFGIFQHVTIYICDRSS